MMQPISPLQTDVVEAEFRGLGFARILLGGVAHLGDFRPAEHGVVVEGHLGIEREHAVVLGDHQRIDLDHGRVQIAERAVAAHDRGDRLADLLDVEAHAEGQFARLKRLQSHRRIDLLLQDALRPIAGDLLDLHAAFRGGDHADAFDFAVEHETQIQRAHERLGLLDIQAVHRLAGGARSGWSRASPPSNAFAAAATS